MGRKKSQAIKDRKKSVTEPGMHSTMFNESSAFIAALPELMIPEVDEGQPGDEPSYEYNRF